MLWQVLKWIVLDFRPIMQIYIFYLFWLFRTIFVVNIEIITFESSKPIFTCLN